MLNQISDLPLISCVTLERCPCQCWCFSLMGINSQCLSGHRVLNKQQDKNHTLQLLLQVVVATMTKIWITRTKWIGFIHCFLKFNKVCLYVDSPFSLLGIRRASAYWCLSSFLKVSQPSLLQNYFSPNLSPSVFPLILRLQVDMCILSFITIFCLSSLLSFTLWLRVLHFGLFL